MLKGASVAAGLCLVAVAVAVTLLSSRDSVMPRAGGEIVSFAAAAAVGDDDGGGDFGGDLGGGGGGD